MESNSSGKILLPCTLVYLDKDGDLEITSSLFFERYTAIWGIKIGRTIFKLTNECMSDWKTATQLPQKYIVGKFKPQLPSVDELASVYLHIAAFDSTARILSRYGVPADVWQQGCYWGREEYSEKHAHVFDMCNGCYDLKPKFHENGFIRLCYPVSDTTERLLKKNH